MEIDTLLELEGILEIIQASVFALQMGDWSPDRSTAPPSVTEQAITRPGTKQMGADTQSRPVSSRYLFFDQQRLLVTEGGKIQILLHGSSRSADPRLLL